jgi:hypothetical protein
MRVHPVFHIELLKEFNDVYSNGIVDSIHLASKALDAIRQDIKYVSQHTIIEKTRTAVYGKVFQNNCKPMENARKKAINSPIYGKESIN